ncbi:ClbS/DfsB family four-helix bundle protein [Anaerosinus massiliensis]|uniref:ClbS/DfsB family four-helix bundle protein n=1 Tax=Massilibacillus massiliensis TaxID=1806837 RepID=UPI000B231796|nr:ClbS/DfsB family four-helix bundle protein [Massilibacillus massiliensis]
MQTYSSKAELITAVKTAYMLFDKEFDGVSEAQKALRFQGVDKTPQEMLAYQLGWLNLVMGWEDDELNGREVVTPSLGYKWNQLGQLYQSFYTAYRDYTLQALRSALKKSVDAWCAWIEQLSDEELFIAGTRKWTVTSANWPMWKWIHINSAAPFKNFRPKIRKWKKLVFEKTLNS